MMPPTQEEVKPKEEEKTQEEEEEDLVSSSYHGPGDAGIKRVFHFLFSAGRSLNDDPLMNVISYVLIGPSLLYPRMLYVSQLLSIRKATIANTFFGMEREKYLPSHNAFQNLFTT